MPQTLRPAVFLDRDGVITEEVGYVTSLAELRIFPYAASCIRQIHEKGYYAIVITNQSAVARGLLSEEELQKINKHLTDETKADAVYYCPHLEEGIIGKYRKKCNCRKPKTGLIEQACSEYAIDLEHSYMVGDRASDIELGINAGIKTALLESGYGCQRLESGVSADYVLKDLRDFIEILQSNNWGNRNKGLDE